MQNLKTMEITIDFNGNLGPFLLAGECLETLFSPNNAIKIAICMLQRTTLSRHNSYYQYLKNLNEQSFLLLRRRLSLSVSVHTSVCIITGCIV